MSRKLRITVIGSCVAIAAIAYQLTISSVPEIRFADARKNEMLGSVTTECPKCKKLADHRHLKQFFCHCCKVEFTAAKHARIRFIQGENEGVFWEPPIQ